MNKEKISFLMITLVILSIAVLLQACQTRSPTGYVINEPMPSEVVGYDSNYVDSTTAPVENTDEVSPQVGPSEGSSVIESTPIEAGTDDTPAESAPAETVTV